MNPKKRLIICRGISGSGKSTKAWKLVEEKNIQNSVQPVEADMFQMVDGYYKFDTSRMGDAHKWCQLEVERQLRHYGIAVVSNTSTTLRELMVYWNIAARNNADVYMMESDTAWAKDPEECFKRNVHNVPLDVIKAQLERWFHIPCGIYDPNDLIAKY